MESGCKIIIPKKFTLFGETITVKLIKKIDKEDSMGEYNPEKNTIKIKSSLNQDQKESTFCHELVHCLLFSLGYQNLNEDEVFVDNIGRALHQVLITSK